MKLLKLSLSSGGLAASALLVAGCNMGQSAPDAAHSYPVSPPTVTAEPATAPVAATPTPAAIKVPANAVELSSGDYPPPAFPEPTQAGLIMVVDMDGDPTTAVASTAVNGKEAGKMMSITDVANMSITMNKLHKYRIVFVPGQATMP
jgi:hypothetical protein